MKDSNLYLDEIHSPNSQLKAILCRFDQQNQNIFGTCSLIPFEDSKFAIVQTKALCKRANTISSLYALNKAGAHLSIYGPQHLILDQVELSIFYQYIASLFEFNFVFTAKDKAKAILFGPTCIQTPIDLFNSKARAVFEVVKQFQNVKKIDKRHMKVAIQGLGRVGFALSELCSNEGYQIYASDISDSRCREAASIYGLTIIQPDQLYLQNCSVLCLCAIGAVLNDLSRPLLDCDLVVGSTQFQKNNDLDLSCEDMQCSWIPDLLIDPSILAFYINDMDEYLFRLKNISKSLL